jgi:chemotaxis response regulator CheB
MNVGQITAGLKVEPNGVYVIPPNGGLAIKHGRLRLLQGI